MANEVSKAEFSRIRGVSAGRVTQYISEGMPVLPNGKLDQAICEDWLKANVDTTKQVRPGEPQPRQALDLNRERARLAKEQADKAAMENAARRGETITRTDFVRATQGMIVQARAKMLGIPSKLAGVLAATDNPRAVQDKLTTAIHEALADLASTRGVSSSPREPGDGGSSNGGDEGVGAAAPPNRKRVGRPKPDAESGGKRRARKVGHEPG